MSIIRPHAVTGEAPGLGRRDFVQTTGGILLTTSGLAACSGEGLLDPAEFGTLTVDVLGTNQQDTGTVTVDALSGALENETPQEFTITDGTRTEDLPPGEYELTYAPPQDFIVSATTPNVQTVTIETNTESTATFEIEAVQAPTGVMEFQVTSLDASASTGGSVLVEAVNVPGVTFNPTTYQITASGSRSETLPAGDYQVTYTPPSQHTVSSGTQNPQSVTVVDSMTVVVSFDVTFTGGGGGGNADIYEHTLEDGSSGLFHNGKFNPFLTSTAWVVDTSDAARGTQSVRWDIPVTPGNRGNHFYFTFGDADASTPLRSHYFIRFAAKFSAGFDFADNIKIIRQSHTVFGKTTFTLISSANGGNDFRVNPGNAQPNPPISSVPPNQPGAPRPRDLAGQWFWIEMEIDMQTTSTGTFRVWIDDQLTHDITRTDWGAPTASFAQVYLPLFVNSMPTASQFWVDHLGFSTQKMGIP